MEYISAEEFLKQDKNVQDVFLYWWEPKEFDLIQVKFCVEDDIEDIDNGIYNSTWHTEIDKSAITPEDISKYGIEFFNPIHGGIDGKVIPLLTEGQLRKFIEDNINKKVDIIHYINEGYILVVDEDIDYSNLGHDLLQAYWKVAVQIASENIK
ncbi:hypothetical protein [Clostridium botulinum]|uniref:hypothetical protein n=1 Tax=Clostridium botulinum TaxID=1491 RepID=UPI00077436B7|nr:hypothetical protein [Clostridium botulinum]MBY6932297.1 hypothetical protein [Clostridium botulinum]NFG22295.1 hypothetical protein [Clostridium botulinum]NFO82714.1 hypothetical protein [Clostridium botulinum]